MILTHPTHTLAEATEKGYVSITVPYEHHEREILDKAIKQMQGTQYMVVLDHLKRPELFRKKSELRFDK